MTNGKDLENLDSLWFSHPGIKAVPKIQESNGKKTPIANTFMVTVGKEVPAGVYDVRAHGLYGLSNPRSFVVGDLLEKAEAEPNNKSDQATAVAMDSVVNAGLQGATDVDYFSFPGKKGEKVSIDCRAARIDSPMVAVVELYGPDNKRLASERDTFRNDPYINLTLPQDGTYQIKVFDLTYSGGAQHVYRLSVHKKPHIEFIMPPSGTPGTTSNYTLYGYNLPGGKISDWSIGDEPLQEVQVSIALPAKPTTLEMGEQGFPHEVSADGFSYVWESPAGSSNPVTIFFAEGKIVRDEQTKEETLSIPGEFVGQFEAKNDVDTFRFTGKAKEKYSIEVFGQRNGIVMDPVIVVDQVIKDKEGKETFKRLANVGATSVFPDLGGKLFDTRTDDPYYLFTAPADGEYRVTLRDLQFETRGNPRMVYRAVLRQPKPDYRLVALPLHPQAVNTGGAPAAIALRKGDSFKISVMALRQDGFNETIDLSVKGLPAGVTCKAASIGAGSNNAEMIITADESAKKWSGQIEIVGHAAGPDAKKLERVARAATVLRPVAVNIRAESRIARSLGLSVIDEVAPYQVVADVAEVKVNQGRQILVPVKVVKRTGFDNAVALAWSGVPKNSNITTQNKTIAKGKQEELFQVFVKNNAKPGVYTTYLQSTVDVSYRRNPGQVDDAKKEQAELAKKLTDAQAALAAATKKRDEIAKASDKTAEQKKAEQAKAEAEVKAATASVKAADAAKKASDKKVAAAEKAAAPKTVKVYAPSTPLVIRVNPAPVTLTLNVPSGGALKKGAGIDVKATIKRINNFKGPVELTLPLPPGVKGVTATTVQIPADQTEATIPIKAGADATEGDLANMVVRAKADFQGEALVDAPIKLKVTK
ncbi:PPC domain-containing protein [Gimesia alba]|uniref:PPC domain-containing protein n=1 Tax=Gimesia alba TaxID=2527973 RepID=UPI0018D7F985|nr:PPC domain-containing protein [Gimesia alba]